MGGIRDENVSAVIAAYYKTVNTNRKLHREKLNVSASEHHWSWTELSHNFPLFL